MGVVFPLEYGVLYTLGEVERLKSERMVPQREVQIRPDSCRMAIEHKASWMRRRIGRQSLSLVWRKSKLLRFSW